ncbi:hypothetical protein MTO96_035067 [Rhipicephalus appendiculatus]
MQTRPFNFGTLDTEHTDAQGQAPPTYVRRAVIQGPQPKVMSCAAAARSAVDTLRPGQRSMLSQFHRYVKFRSGTTTILDKTSTVTHTIRPCVNTPHERPPFGRAAHHHHHRLRWNATAIPMISAC